MRAFIVISLALWKRATAWFSVGAISSKFWHSTYNLPGNGAAAFSQPEADVQPAPDVATPRLTPEHGAAAVTEREALMAENDELRDEVDDLKATLAHTLEDNAMMGRVFDADGQVKAAMAEATRHKALMENTERMLSARSHEFNERAHLVTYWKNRAEKAEKQVAKGA